MLKPNIYKLLAVVFKNLAVFLVGGVMGAVATLLFAEPLLKATIKQDVGLGIIAIAPALLVIYSLILGLAGGFLAIIIYNLTKLKKRKGLK